ncbi:MAG: NAD-dependent epimerase/dehydratase family protein [Paracoccaceae bacterium]
MPSALVTGSAGFIGYHICQRLLTEGWQVAGFDALTDYYDVALKQRRHEMLAQHADFAPLLGMLEDDGLLADILAERRPDVVMHLAAQAGVRHSIDAPRSYVHSNLVGTFNLLEAVRATPVQHLLMASTSSVYGANTRMPYREIDKTDSQMSFYAATKKANEAMAHSYAHLYDIPVTMFRFFTVYGPWGRPDMAYFKFTRAILNGDPIEVYNHGNMRRDFTYIDDLVEALFRLNGVPPERPASIDDIVEGDSLSAVAPFRIVNIGNAAPVDLMDFIVAIELAIGDQSEKIYKAIQPGDVPATWADTSLLRRLIGYGPSTPVIEGIAKFVVWYKDYYQA